MRVVRLILLGLLAFGVTLVVLFPAAPVVERLRPQLGPVALEGVEGPLVAGRIARVRSTDDLLPLEFSDVGWSLAPLAIARGAAVDVTFDGYGGGGAGQVLRAWNGDIRVEDLTFTAESKALEPLLPVPIASFSGALAGDIARVVLENELLTTLEGTLSWSDAVLETPIRAAFGSVDVDVAKSGDASHLLTLGARGGDVTVDGTVSLTLGGDFVADVLVTPTGSASPDLRAALDRVARPDADGRYRLQRSGNVNRLM